MLWIWSERIACIMVPDGDTERREIYQYGSWILLRTISQIFEIMLLGIVFHCVAESIIYLSILMVLRSYTGGYHANTAMRCNIMGICCFIITLFCGKWLVIWNQKWIVDVMLIAVEILIFLKAPVEHPNKPLTDKEKKRYWKYSIVLSLGICIGIELLYDRYQAEMTYAAVTMFMVAVMMLAGIFVLKLKKS